MRFGWKESRARAWLPLGIPILLLLAGALFSGWIAWHEAERARSTGQMLLRDYASFVADKFARISASRYQALMGISSPAAAEGSPFTLLRVQAQARKQRLRAQLPNPDSDLIRYYFFYDAESRRLEISGSRPPAEEHNRLREALSNFDLKCAPNQIFTLSRLEVPGSKSAPGASDASPWSALIEADEGGLPRRAYGFRLDEGRSVEEFFLPIITRARDCDCISGLLPASLAHLSDARQAASFVLRDGAGHTVYASEPQYEGSSAVKQPLSPELPFAGWTVEVAINAEAVQPLLPYGGGGTPWLALALAGILVFGSGALAIQALRRQTELSRLRQDLVSNVSHELKTPLARIRLFNELLMGEKQTDLAKRSHYREIIERECRRLSFLVDNILDFSRLERGAQGHEKLPLNLRQAVEEAVDTFRACMDQGRLSLSARLEDVPPVAGDAHSLEQVVINLLDNAVKYSPEASPIELRLTSDDGFVRLSVADHGYGIPTDQQERIFEPFYRVESGDQQQAAGSGLGLSLVRRTVEDHGGRVTVESKPGEGSTFVVEIPVAGR